MATRLAQLRYSRIGDPADFGDPGFRGRLEELFGRAGEKRAQWPAAAAAGAIEALGAAGEDDDALVLGPGNDALAAWLTPRARRVAVAEGAPPAGTDDESFDLVCCAHLLERLPSVAHAASAVREVFRVLRPAGAASLATTFRLSGSGPGPGGLLLFGEEELRGMLLAEGLTWALTSPLDEAVSGDRGRGAGLVERSDEAEWTSIHLFLVKPLFH